MSHAQRIRRRRRGRGGPRNKAFLALMVIGIALVLAGLAASATSSRSRPPRRRCRRSRRAPRRQHARLRHGRPAARLHPGRRAAPAAALGGHPAGRQGRHGGDRGRALLQAQGRRLRGRHPRRGEEPHVAQDRPGRLDDHDAAGPLALHLQRAHLPRKIREAKLAEELENEHSKEWILEKYLDSSRTARSAASRRSASGRRREIYFSKDAPGPRR